MASQFRESPMSRAGIKELQQWPAMALADHPQCPYGGSSGREDALWRTHMADTPLQSDAASPPETRAYVETWYGDSGWSTYPQAPTPQERFSRTTIQAKVNTAVRAVYEYWEQRNGRVRAVNRLCEIYDAQVMPRRYEACLRRIYGVCAHRAMYVSAKGYIGLAP